MMPLVIPNTMLVGLVFTVEMAGALRVMLPSTARLFTQLFVPVVGGRVTEAKPLTAWLNRWNVAPPSGPRFVTVNVAVGSMVMVDAAISPLFGVLVALMLMLTAPPSSMLPVMFSEPVVGEPLVSAFKAVETVLPAAA